MEAYEYGGGIFEDDDDDEVFGCQGGATHCKDIRDKVQDYLDSRDIIGDQEEVSHPKR